MKAPGPPVRFVWRTIAGATGMAGALAAAGIALHFALTNRSSAALLWHLVAAAITTAATWALLPDPYRSPLAIAFLCVVALFVPFVGGAGLLLGVVLPLYFPKARSHIPWEKKVEPALPLRAPKIDAQMIAGEGALVATLRQNREPEQRLRAVLAARQMRDREMIPILRVALKDRVDDVRLLAYATLDRKEQGLLSEIQSATSRLGEGAEPTERARLHRRIAESYWELAYLGLASGEVLAHALLTARTHLGSARDIEPQNPGLAFLLGRVLLAEGKYAEARDALGAARALGFSKNQVLPYLAEVAFLDRRFSEVRPLLDELDPLAARTSPLAAVVQYWSS